LSAREFALLETLMRHPGRVFTREQLLSQVWNLDFDPGSNVVDVYMGYLRRKLGADYFVTVGGAGVTADDVNHITSELETYDFGRDAYDVEFQVGGVGYEYEIDAATGEILRVDKD
jgi:DNA-binding winged helix-turn-helix (wHTH) protein